jgi:membrane-bound serine protease (ClpP class)
MRRWALAFFCLLQLFGWSQPVPGQESAPQKVFVLPIRDDIMPPMVYLVRRGVKEAMEAKADALILDMETNGGRVDTTEEIIEILNQFKGLKVTYVNRKAFSAGAFISFATQKIYMAPQSVIGAAAPIMMSPGGTGAEALPDTMEVKMTSALSALVRANAEKNGHNPEVADAMVKKTKELIIDEKVINEKGQILTLTDKEASAKYGEPAKPLLSLGTIDSMDKLLGELGFKGANVTRVEETGAEKLAMWLNRIAPILLIVGIIGFYIEFKTPGFGLPGTVGLVAFVLYFLGGYIAGLSGAEWVVVFLIGVTLVLVELFLFPGVMVLGLAGVALILVAIVMALVDVYPNTPVFPLPEPSRESLQESLQVFITAVGGSIAIALLLAKLLPKTPLYHTLVSQTVSGERTITSLEKKRAAHLGQLGVTLSPLRPGGRAQFGDEIIDVISQGEMVTKGQAVKIVGFSGPDAIVEIVS